MKEKIPLKQAEKTVRQFINKRDEWKYKTAFKEVHRQEYLTLELHTGTEKYFSRPNLRQAINIAKKYPREAQLKHLRPLVYKVLEDAGCLKEIFPEKYTIEECLLKASSYRGERFFLRHSPVAHKILKKAGQMDKAKWAAPVPPPMKQSEAIKLAKKFKQRSELKEKHARAYWKLRASKLLDQFFPLKESGRGSARSNHSRSRLNLDLVKGFCMGRGDIKCIDTVYINAHTLMKFECVRCGKAFKAIFGNIKGSRVGCKNLECMHEEGKFPGNQNGNPRQSKC